MDKSKEKEFYEYLIEGHNQIKSIKSEVRSWFAWRRENDGWEPTEEEYIELTESYMRSRLIQEIERLSKQTNHTLEQLPTIKLKERYLLEWKNMFDAWVADIKKERLKEDKEALEKLISQT